MSVEAKIVTAIERILEHQGIDEVEVAATSLLYDEGLDLDSMCVAELSAVLEKIFGTDPYTSGENPQSVQDLVDFYEPGA